MSPSRFSRAGIGLLVLLFVGLGPAAAAPAPDKGASSDMGAVRAELLRLRSERSRLRDSLSTGEGGGPMAVTGYVSVETEYRFSNHDRDVDTTFDVYAQIGDDRFDPITGSFSGRLLWDQNGLVRRAGRNVPADDATFVDYNDLEARRLTQHIDTAYVDFNRLGPLDKVRIGRQFHDGYTGGHFDGTLVSTDPVAKTTFSLYGGVPVNDYKFSDEKSTWSGDRIYGGDITNRFIENLTLTLDVQGARDRMDLFGTRRDYQAVLGVKYDFLKNLQASLVESVIDGQQRDLNGTIVYWNPEYDLSLTVNYIWMPQRLDDLTNEYTPYTDIMGSLDPYQLFHVMAAKGLGDHFEVGGEFTSHELVDSSDESDFDKEYYMTRASFSVINLPIDGLTSTAHYEYWDSTDDSQHSLGGEIRKRLGRSHSIEAGTYYSKFKYREYSYIESVDVQTYFVKWRWTISSDLGLNVRAEVEDAEDDTYNTLAAALTFRF